MNFEDFEKFSEKFKKKWDYSSVPKNVKGGTFGIFKHPFCCKISKQMKEHFGPFQNFSKILSAEKILVKNTETAKGEIFSIFRGFVSFCFGEVLRFRAFWTSVVQVVEQMNKKVDLTRLKKKYLL